MLRIPHPSELPPSTADRFLMGITQVLAQAQERKRMQQEFEKEREILDLQKNKFELDKRNTDHMIKVADMAAKRQGFLDTEKNAQDTFNFMQGAPAPVGDMSQGVSGIQGLPQFDLSGALGRATGGGREDMSGAQPMGRLQEVMFPLINGGVLARRPQTDIELAAVQARAAEQGRLLNLQKVKDETTVREKIKSDYRPDGTTPLPTAASLAVAAAKGDATAAKALKLLKPEEKGTSIPSLDALPEGEQTTIRNLADRVVSGEITTAEARGLLGGVHGKRGVAFVEALNETGSKVVPSVVRVGLQDLKRTKNMITEARSLVEEIIQEPDPLERVRKSVILENYTKSVGTMIARGFGERGVVTDKDRDAAIGLVPGWKSTNFDPKFAYSKLAILDTIINKNEQALTQGFFETIPNAGGTPRQGGTGGGPAIGTERVINGTPAVWDGKGWKAK